MHSFQIFSDGACDLTLEAQNSYHISTVPFYVSFDGKTYMKELKELTLEHFYHHLIEEKGFPKTSLPSVHDFVEAFTPALQAGKDILSLHITHRISRSQNTHCRQLQCHRLSGTAPDGSSTDAAGRKIPGRSGFLFGTGKERYPYHIYDWRPDSFAARRQNR